MKIEKNFIKEFIKVTQHAAISTYHHVGKNNKEIADKAATNIMREKLNRMNIKGKIVIGEGELDEAPMLYIGEKVGNNRGPEFDIAVDPVEGTNFVAKNLPGAISVMAIAKKNELFKAPESYMQKIAFGKNIEKGVVDLDFKFKKNIQNLADFKNKKLEEISICILDRPRHKEIIDEAYSLKVKIKLITDGDVSGALLVAQEKNEIDLFLGVGGGPEGVLAASALDAYGCGFQGRFIFDNENLKSRALNMGITDLNKKYEISEIIKGDSIFCATGITDGDLVKGISKKNGFFNTHTLITHKSQNYKKILVEDLKFDL
tara:strand:+ start:2042 stop:2992 length:951 start_codon:yes stop_codon:yes gene_type:complete